MSDARTLYKMAQRRLVATLLYVGQGANEVFEIVNPENMDEPALELILTSMIQLTRKNEMISAVSVARELEKSGDLEKAGGIADLHALHAEGEGYSLEAPIEVYAEILRDTSAKSKITRVLEEAKDNFKDDSGISTVDGVSELQSMLNQELVGLSDESTVTTVQGNVHSYEELIEERRQVSIANKEQADGLQGIPSLLPTLNKYTHGWAPSQLITVGARTGVGKALAIDTPILTVYGWKTMGEIQIGDKVYGRDGKPTNVVNVTGIQNNRKVYEVRFNNDEVIVADEDHLWITEDLEARMGEDVEKVRTTKELVETLKYSDSHENLTNNHSIKLTKPLDNEAIDFSVEPYSFGRALTEGVISEDLSTIAESLDETVESVLNGYLFGSKAQREELVKGLLSEDKDETPYMYFSDKNIASTIRTIFASLGYMSFLDYDEEDYAYRVSFYAPGAFGLKNEHSVYISEIVEIESVPVKCIQVDNEDHTYLAGESLIPTHNSVFAVNNAVAAARAGKSVLFFTLEMSNSEIDDRIIASMSGVSMSKLKEGDVSDEDMSLVRNSVEDLKDMKIMVDSDPRVTVDTIRARAFKQAQSADGLDLIIVDYLQLIAPVGRFSSRQEAVADISRNMKLTAKTLQVPIIVLVQLNRGKSDEEENKLPSLEDIRESASIAMDSDIVILLHRDDNFDDTTPHTLVILDKNRNGESHKVIRCHSNLECSLFREVKREKEVSDERLSDEEMSELEADIDLDDFDGYDLDDNDLDL